MPHATHMKSTVKSLRDVINLYKRYKVIFDNIFFVGLIQVFGFIAPLITYPYLVKVLGMELYGVVLTAQMVVSFATMIIDFGSNGVCAKDIAIHRGDKKKHSEILSAVLSMRLKLWLLCFGVYLLVVWWVPAYHDHFLLFALSYFFTMNELLFPQFYFQGVEKMKIVALLGILIKLVFICLIFLVIKDKSHYLLVPVLYAVGYALAGGISLYIIFKKDGLTFYQTTLKQQFTYLKECFPILSTNLICIIKDKINYLLVGMNAGMGNVVIFDLGLKINSIINQPVSIFNTVMLPRFARNRSTRKLNRVLFLSTLICLAIVIVTNIFMEEITFFFLHREIDLIPLRLFTIMPLFFTPSVMISANFYIGFGFNRYMLYSILFTTSIYLLLLVGVWITGYITSLYCFVFLSLFSYIAEFLFRLITYIHLSKKLHETKDPT